MENTLVLFAHPYLEHSKSNKELINFYVRHQHYTFRDLYEEFPEFHIPAFRERKRIAHYDRIIFHFPLIWFGIPPLLKLWIDEVFDLKWQKEFGDNPLKNKEVVILVTTNYKEEQFGKNGVFKYTIEELISGLFVVLKQNKLKIKDFLCIYNVDQLEKKEIIMHKHHYMAVLNGG
ncbi:MAG: NAD(P)H-dependent oxidoreductase [Weeksellaceae bacterium]|nr:NAD(P)H-dependent oxidoreductase [Weeksellaceae bacterium]